MHISKQANQKIPPVAHINNSTFLRSTQIQISSNYITKEKIKTLFFKSGLPHEQCGGAANIYFGCDSGSAEA
jgi:hypothetical protein